MIYIVNLFGLIAIGWAGLLAIIAVMVNIWGTNRWGSLDTDLSILRKHIIISLVMGILALGYGGL